MSEQPTNVTSIDNVRHFKEGDVLSDETRFDLHRNNTVPNFNRDAIEAGRAAFAAASIEMEREQTPTEIAAFQLQTLKEAREEALAA